MPDSNTLEVEFPRNGCTLSGLLALFREAKEEDSNHKTNFFPDELDDARREIYNNLEDVDGFTLTVEFEE